MSEERRMPMRVVNLKHIELTTPNYSESPIYEVLSNLIVVEILLYHITNQVRGR